MSTTDSTADAQPPLDSASRDNNQKPSSDVSRAVTDSIQSSADSWNPANNETKTDAVSVAGTTPFIRMDLPALQSQEPGNLQSATELSSGSGLQLQVINDVSNLIKDSATELGQLAQGIGTNPDSLKLADDVLKTEGLVSSWLRM